MSTRKAEMVLEIIDRATRPLRKLMDTSNRFSRLSSQGAERSARAARLAEMASRAQARAVEVLARAQSSLDRALERTNRNLARQAERLRAGTALMHSGARDLAGSVGTALGVMISLKSAAVGLAASLIGPAAEFENFQIRLNTLEGSAEKGQAAMLWIEDFATRTPLELDQVVSSFAQMRSFGLDPTDGSMRKMLDTASAMGGGYEMLTSMTLALGKAQTTGKLQGESIQMLMGRGIPVYELLGAKMGKSAEQIQNMASKGKLGRKEIALLIDAMGARFAGASENMSRTWGGMTSNLLDWATKFRRMVAGSGVFDFMKARLQQLLETLQQIYDSGKMQEWADAIGHFVVDGLQSIVTFGERAWRLFQKMKPSIDQVAAALGGYRNLAIAIIGLKFSGALIGAASGLVKIALGAGQAGWAVSSIGWSYAAKGAILLGRGLLFALNPMALLRGGAAGAVAGARALASGFMALISPMNLVRGAAVLMRLALIATGVGAIALGIAAAGVWIYNNWNGLVTFFAEFGAGFREALGPAAPILDAITGAISGLFGWLSKLFGPLDASGKKWASWGRAAGTAVGSVIRWVVDLPHKIKAFFSDLPNLDWSSVLRFGWLKGIWGKVSGWIGSVGSTLWDALNPLSWVGLVKSDDLKAAWSAVSGYLGGVLSNIWTGLGSIKWGELISIDGLKNAWNAVLSFLGAYYGTLWDALSPLSWVGLVKSDDLQAAWGAVSSYLVGALANVWAGLGSIEWLGLVDLSGLASAWGAVSDWIGQKAAALWDAIPDINWKFWDDGEINDPQTLLAAAQAADRLASEFPGISKAANDALRVSQAVLRSITMTVSGLSLAAEGARIVQSLADGMRSKVAEVAAAATAVGNAIRTALPAGASASISMQGAALDGARASGGPVWRGGRFLVGERGPEMFVPRTEGMIMPNHALRTMAAARPAMRSFAVGRDASSYLPGVAQGGSVTVSAPLTLSVAGSADKSTVAEIDAVLRRHRDQIVRAAVDAVGNAARDKGRRGHS